MFRLQRLEITGFKSFADYTEILFTGDGITAVVGPNGCGKCVSGDTLITLADGREVEIRELVETTLDKSFFKEQFNDGFLTHENPNNIEILSLNPETLKLETRKVSAFIKRETTEKLLHVRTRSGREIKATPYHPLFTLESGKLRALRADELKVGLRIAVPRNLSVKTEEFELSSENYLRKFDLEDRIFVPYSEDLQNWANEGKKQFKSFSKWTKTAKVSAATLQNLRSKQSINVSEVNKLLAVCATPLNFDNRIKSHQSGFLNLPTEFNPKLAKFLGLLIAEGRNTYSSQVWFVNSDDAVNQEFKQLAKEIFNVQVVQKDYKKGSTDSLIFSQSLCKTLEKVFNFPINSNSFEKEVPSQIFQASAETKWAFLSGLFEGDAYVCSRPQKSNGKILNYIEYSTASEKLANQVISLLLQLGVFAYLRPKQKYASNTKEKRVRNYFSVLIYGSKQLSFAAKQLNFIGEKQVSLERLRNIAVSDNPNQDLIPTATELVREAVKLAKVAIKPNKKNYPKISAYTGKICEASRNGLNEVVEQIRYLSENSEPAHKVLENLTALANSDVYWDEIISVEEIEPTEKWVYDLSIDETHNFVAGNIIVHNSNVSESISWVLGEQRAKALRGAEMQDVIFQGTSKRKPGGMSEVVLHLVRDEESFFEDEELELGEIDEAISELDENTVNFDELEPRTADNGFHPVNIELAETVQVGAIETVQAKAKPKRHWRPRRMALDFAPGESISVTRRLYRSGESEYLLNGKSCRLRDIQDLFAGTGLSGSHYAIIEQGRIGQILSSKPADRRNLIEEAAGISKFRTRQRAAESRLDSAKINLRRISDIVEEIDKQANSLRRQASKTKRYKVLKEELRTGLRQLFATEGKFLTELVNDLETKLDKAVTLERDLFSEVATKDESFRISTQKAREAEESLSNLRARHAENALQRDRAERDLLYKKEQTTGLENRVEILKRDVEATGQRLSLIKSETERLQKDEAIERAEAGKQELALREAEQAYQSKTNELRQIETNLEKIRNEVFQHTTAFERLSEIRRQHENNIERLTERAEGLKREGLRAEDAFKEHLAESENLKKELVKAQENQSRLQKEKKVLTESANETRQLLQSAEKDLAKVREDFSRTRHRLETLRELEEKRTIYAPAVQKLFAEQSKIGVKFIGTLADNFHVAAIAEKAVESIFGAFLQTVLVETEAEATKVFEYLNKNNFGRIAVLVFNAEAQGRKDAEETNGQITQVKGQKIFEFLGISESEDALLKAIFPREMSAEVVETFDEIKPNSKGMFVNYNGDWLIDGKLFVGGKANSNEKSSSLLAFKRELRELEINYEKLRSVVESAEKVTEEFRKTLTEKQDKLSDLQTFIVKSEREVLSQEIQSKSLAQETERAERHRRVVAEEVKQIEKEFGEIRVKLSETETNSNKAKEAKFTASNELENITRKLSGARQKVEKENIELNEKRTLAGIAAERRRSVLASLRRLETEANEFESRFSRQNLEINENEINFKNLIAEIDEITRKIELAQDEKETESAELIELTTGLKLAREAADVMSDELAELNKRSAEARNSRAGFEVSQAETVTRLKNLNETCSHELNQSLVELVETVEIDENFELKLAQQQTEDLRNRIESFGAVNMLALEELSETEERLLFLTSQRQDIIDSIAAAEEALREIKQRSREKFRHAFEVINDHFSEFFFELFGGGRGEMTLIEAEDILESGIEIIAQPPGKRLQNILLLSGGEKAMTAIALVMAIFKYRPSPFCLLDEVDAPLDDANVGRFVNKIAEMSEKTQFIVITHNKRTMEAAKALYGVTMEEAGISKVVSVRFE